MWAKQLFTFGQFLVSDPTTLRYEVFILCVSCCVQLLQDTLGYALILGSGTVELASSGFRPTRQDVFEFINQCGDISSTNPDEVSHLKGRKRVVPKNTCNRFLSALLHL